MKLQGKNALAIVMILCGALILLGKAGWIFGWLVGLIVPIAMIVFGYIGIRNGRTFIGTVLLFLGSVILLGKLSGLIGLAVAVLMIVWGVKMMTGRRAY